MKNLYQLAFFVPPRDDVHQLFWHQLRDCGAVTYLREALLKAGTDYTFAGIIRNVPHAPGRDLFKAGDLIVATTRFPLNDRLRKSIPTEEDADKRTVVPGENDLEGNHLFPIAHCFFQFLSRSMAELTPAATKYLKDGFKDRRLVAFSNERGARYTGIEHHKASTSMQRTAAYLISVPLAWPGGPGFLWSFGLSGETGLIWNRLLCTEFTRMLKQPHFAIAEFDVPHKSIPKHVAGSVDRYGPGTLDWASSNTLNLKLAVDRELTPEDLKALGLPSQTGSS